MKVHTNLRTIYKQTNLRGQFFVADLYVYALQHSMELGRRTLYVLTSSNCLQIFIRYVPTTYYTTSYFFLNYMLTDFVHACTTTPLKDIYNSAKQTSSPRHMIELTSKACRQKNKSQPENSWWGEKAVKSAQMAHTIFSSKILFKASAILFKRINLVLESSPRGLAHFYNPLTLSFHT